MTCQISAVEKSLSEWKWTEREMLFVSGVFVKRTDNLLFMTFHLHVDNLFDSMIQ